MKPLPPNMAAGLLEYFRTVPKQRIVQLRVGGWTETPDGWIHHIHSPEPLSLEAAINFRGHPEDSGAAPSVERCEPSPPSARRSRVSHQSLSPEQSSSLAGGRNAFE